MDSEAFSLFDDRGQRLYLTADERTAFRAVAKAQGERELRTFCHLLTYTGCRISEALETTPQRLDWNEQTVIFRTLKKRGKKAATTYRAVPLPADFLDELDLIHHLWGKDRIPAKQLLWNWHRSTAWRKVKGVMRAAQIEGTHASPKGLRHGFGVAHALNKTPLPLLQRWMGHSKQETTAIYMQAVGQEERELAGAVW
jgi:integrase